MTDFPSSQKTAENVGPGSIAIHKKRQRGDTAIRLDEAQFLWPSPCVVSNEAVKFLFDRAPALLKSLQPSVNSIEPFFTIHFFETAGSVG